MTPAPLNLGILSTARIAKSFAQAVRPSKLLRVAAVASREEAKALQFARELDIAKPISGYAALLADPEIQAIYNPLPNGLHVEWSRRALAAGKHVLCEKPLCATAHEARELFALAKQQGVHLVEGFPYRAQPQTRKLKQLIEQGSLGRVRLIQASFSFQLVQPNDVRLSAALQGGALMDLGTYCVSLIQLIAGRSPRRVQATALFGEGGAARGVDRTLWGTLEFEDGLSAQIFCSFDAALQRQALIVGERGTVRTTFLNHTSDEMPGHLWLKRGADSRGAEEILPNAHMNGFLAEAESFVALVREGEAQWSGASPAESIAIAMTLEALLRSARSGAPVTL